MRTTTLLSLIAAGGLILSNTAAADTAQITGTVAALTSNSITIKTAKQTRTIPLGGDTIVTGQAKIGATVTVTFTVGGNTVGGSSQHKEEPQATTPPKAGATDPNSQHKEDPNQ